MTALYKPFGLLISVLGGIVSGALLTQAWRKVAGEDGTGFARATGTWPGHEHGGRKAS